MSGNDALKIIIGIVIGAALLVGIYFILPGTVKYPLTSWFQTNFDDDAALVIEKGKGLKPTQLEGKDNSFKVDKTLDELLQANGENVAWYCEVLNRETGLYMLHGTAQKIDIQYEKAIHDGSYQHYTNESIDIRISATLENGQVTFSKGAYQMMVGQYTEDEYGRKAIYNEFVKKVQ